MFKIQRARNASNPLMTQEAIGVPKIFYWGARWDAKSKLPYCGATLAHFLGSCSNTHVIDSTTMIKCIMCYKHNVLKL